MPSRPPTRRPSGVCPLRPLCWRQQSRRRPLTAAAVSAAATTASAVTTTGGISGYLPEFSGVSTIVDSPLFVNGANVGIGTATPTATLDVNGTALVSGALTANGGATVGGTLLLPAVGTATASASFDSQTMKFYTSAWNSTSKATVQPRFQWKGQSSATTPPIRPPLSTCSRRSLPPTHRHRLPLQRKRNHQLRQRPDLPPEPAMVPSLRSLPEQDSPAEERAATFR